MWTASVLAVVAAGCGAATGPATVGRAATGVLTSYSSCGALLGHLKQVALAEVGPSGLAGVGIDAGLGNGATFNTSSAGGALAAPMAAGSTAGAGAAGASAGAAAPSDAAGPSFSSTNDQEAGVDEPDTAKTDGQLLAVVRQQPPGVELASVGGGAPKLESFVPLTDTMPSGLFLAGHDVVVLGSSVPSGVTPMGEPGAAQSVPPSSVAVAAPLPMARTRVVVIDAADPAHPSIARSFTLDGSEVDARLLAGRVDVVVQSSPAVPFVVPGAPGPLAESAATAANRAAVETSTLHQWLPAVTSEPGGATTLPSCASTLVADQPGTLGTVSVVSLDPSADTPSAPLTFVGDATTVYASATTLYIAGTPDLRDPAVTGGPAPSLGAVGGPASVEAPGPTPITAIDLTGGDGPHLLATGTVPGSLIGQYALSEYAGDLRVATTVGLPTPPPNEGAAPAVASDNRVTVLRPEHGALVPVGTASGLGAGEKIYAVRFAGPLAYVVTFRQTDPLYVVDLHDPTAPAVVGQLALTGYSSFLQPLPGQLVLGIGRAVDDNLHADALQLSLFDVSDPATPRLVAKEVMPGAYSTAEDDPHAVLSWPADQLVVLPLEAPPTTKTGDPFVPFTGALALHAAADGLHDLADIAQPPGPQAGTEPGLPPSPPAPVPLPGVAGGGAVGGGTTGSPVAGVAVASPVMSPGIERALVVGTMLYTVSENGIMASDLHSFAQAAWLHYP
jgi:hypothetical protein